MAKEKINPRLEKENIKFNLIVSTDELPISEQILKFATENNIDLIIIGSHRLSEISKIKALGSVVFGMMVITVIATIQQLNISGMNRMTNKMSCFMLRLLT